MITKFKKFKKRDSDREIFFPILLGILVLVGIAFFIVTNYRINQKRKDLLAQIVKLEEQIKTQEKINEDLKSGVSQISDQDYLEEEARERLGLKKPGEEAVSVQKVETEEQKKEEPPKAKSFWDRILEKLRLRR
jgi:cell division protein FtsL